jgi:hypothetical protein
MQCGSVQRQPSTPAHWVVGYPSSLASAYHYTSVFSISSAATFEYLFRHHVVSICDGGFYGRKTEIFSE